MDTSNAPAKPEHIYRVDKFAVPEVARTEFLDTVRRTHAFLNTLPGLVRNDVLEQASGNGEFNFVTIAEWEGQAAIDQARQAVAAMHAQHNFNPQELFARLGIRADLANYRQLDMQKGNA